jgi:nucleoside phosphorylase
MPLSHRDYTVACICPMGVELAPVQAMFDETYTSLPTKRDHNNYVLGQIGGHNIVVAVLPEIGNNATAIVATQLLNDFPAIRFALLVGIGGGVPDLDNDVDVRLGDIVVSKPTKTSGGVVQYDMGKETVNGFERTGTLDKPPAVLRAAVQRLLAQHKMQDSQVPHHLSEMWKRFPKMKEEYVHPDGEPDQLFEIAYNHQGGKTCAGCDSSHVITRLRRPNTKPVIHYGTIGSANKVVKNATERERLRSSNLDIICVEMEAAGLMDSFPCLVVRGICDYADSHKNKKWQPYAAAVAAAYMRELLAVIPAQDVSQTPHASGVVEILRK